MPLPDSPTALQRFLGMANYLAKFVDNLSEMTAPLRQLLHKEVQWTWQHEHQEAAFMKLKILLVSPPVLQYYNVDQPITLTCDASQFGLGTAILQDGKPVVYASRSLKPNEQQHAKIGKELLAIVFSHSSRRSQAVLLRNVNEAIFRLEPSIAQTCKTDKQKISIYHLGC